MEGDKKSIHLLNGVSVKNNANINHQNNDGNTALMILCNTYRNNMLSKTPILNIDSMIRILLSSIKINVNIKNKATLPALYMLTSGQQKDYDLSLILAFIKQGANMSDIQNIDIIRDVMEYKRLLADDANIIVI